MVLTRLGFAVLVCGFAGMAYGQNTLYVNGTTGNDAWSGLCQEWDGATCGPKKTIQAGLNAAKSGDTVLVADGTYTGDGNRDLDYKGKPVTLRSEHGAAKCIIDCEAPQSGAHRGVAFVTGEGTGSVLEGITIQNGYSPQYYGSQAGGGVLCGELSTPIIRNCVFRWNKAPSI